MATRASVLEAGDNAIIKLARTLQNVTAHPVLDFLKIAADLETLGIAAQDEEATEIYATAIYEIAKESTHRKH